MYRPRLAWVMRSINCLPILCLTLSTTCTSIAFHYVQQPLDPGEKGLVLVAPLQVPEVADSFLREFKVQRDAATDEQTFRDSAFPEIARKLALSGREAVIIDSSIAKKLIGDLAYNPNVETHYYSQTENKYRVQSEGSWKGAFWNQKHCKECIKETLAKQSASWLLVPIVTVIKNQGDYPMGNGYCRNQTWILGVTRYLIFDKRGELILDSVHVRKKNIFGQEFTNAGTARYVRPFEEIFDPGFLTTKCGIKISERTSFGEAYSKMLYLFPGESPN